jgi:hypothetical protein
MAGPHPHFPRYNLKIGRVGQSQQSFWAPLCREVPLSFPHVSHRRILRSSYCPKVLRSSAQLRHSSNPSSRCIYPQAFRKVITVHIVVLNGKTLQNLLSLRLSMAKPRLYSIPRSSPPVLIAQSQLPVYLSVPRPSIDYEVRSAGGLCQDVLTSLLASGPYRDHLPESRSLAVHM